jgi:hypothetical protein
MHPDFGSTERRSHRGPGRAGASGAGGAARDPRLESLRSLARALDAAIVIPGTRIRVGLDPLLGLLPGIGDIAAAVIAAYTVLVAWRLGAPPSVLARLVGNVAFDALLGSVPILGDLADVAFRANSRNVRLLEGWAERPSETRRTGRLVLYALLAALVAVTVAGVALAFLGLRALFRSR